VTITAPRPSRTPVFSLVWKHAATDLYAATLGGEFAGYVAAVDDRHTTFGPHAQCLGSHRSFRAASAALHDWWMPPDGFRAPDRPRLALPAGLKEWPAVSPAAS
jgi:hypothetical protein